MRRIQEPKYNANEFGHIYNRATSIVIPDDEPIFIFRAKDKYALAALHHYQKLCIDQHHKDVIGNRIDDFERFRDKNFQVMDEPDSA